MKLTLLLPTAVPHHHEESRLFLEQGFELMRILQFLQVAAGIERDNAPKRLVRKVPVEGLIGGHGCVHLLAEGHECLVFVHERYHPQQGKGKQQHETRTQPPPEVLHVCTAQGQESEQRERQDRGGNDSQRNEGTCAGLEWEVLREE